MMNTTELLALAGSASATTLGAIAASSQLPDHFALVVISGLCGGLCRTIAEREPFWPHAVGTILTGLLVAAFLWPAGGPLLAPIIGPLELAPVSEAMLGGFVTGLMGVSLIGIILDFTKARRRKIEEDLEP